MVKRPNRWKILRGVLAVTVGIWFFAAAVYATLSYHEPSLDELLHVQGEILRYECSQKTRYAPTTLRVWFQGAPADFLVYEFDGLCSSVIRVGERLKRAEAWFNLPSSKRYPMQLKIDGKTLLGFRDAIEKKTRIRLSSITASYVISFLLFFYQTRRPDGVVRLLISEVLRVRS